MFTRFTGNESDSVYTNRLEGTEALLSGNHTLRLVCDNIESDRLAERTALTDGDNVSFLDGKGRRAMHSNVRVTLLKTTVFGNVMKVVSSDNNGALHLGGDDASLEDTTADRDISREWALLVNIVAFNGSRWRLDTETNILDEAHGLVLVGNGALAGHKNGILLLVRLFVLVALDIFSGNARHDGRVCQSQGKRRKEC